MSQTLTVLSFSRLAWRSHLLYALRTTSTDFTWMDLSLFIGFIYSCQGEQVHRAPHTAILETELLFTFTVRIPGFVLSDPILLARVKRLRVEHLTQDGPEPFTRKLLLRTRSLLIRTVRREHQRTMENEETRKGLSEFLRMLWLLDPANPFSLLSGPLWENSKRFLSLAFKSVFNSYDLGLPWGKFYFEQISINPPWKRGQEWLQEPKGKVPTS